MPQDNFSQQPQSTGTSAGAGASSLPTGAGATTGSTTSQSGFAASGETRTVETYSATPTRASQPSPESGFYSQDQHESGYRETGRAVVVTERPASKPSTPLVVGAAIAGAIAGGAIPFMFASRSSKSSRGGESAYVEETVTINRSARELYDFWRDFENLPQFMENIQSVRTLSERTSHWVIKAPAGTSVEFDSFVTEDIPGKLIAWRSDEDASVPNRGRVEFIEASSGATVVRASISYDPPAGAAGRLIAKLFQREPGVQARQDLNRFKQLMESRGSR